MENQQTKAQLADELYRLFMRHGMTVVRQGNFLRILNNHSEIIFRGSSESELGILQEAYNQLKSENLITE